MVMAPGRVAELTNGYEQRTSGLYTHRGRMDVGGGVRVTGYLNMPTGAGAGLEFGYIEPAGYIQSYDHNSNTSRDLIINGRNITLAPQGGTLNLPAGSVTSAAIADGTIQTADLAANAATAMLGWYLAAPSWTNTTLNTWMATPITSTVATTGGTTLVFATLNFYHSAAGANTYVGLALDSSVSMYHIVTTPTANGYVSCGLTWMVGSPPAGSHTFAIYIYQTNAGTVTVSTGSHSNLLVVELRR